MRRRSPDKIDVVIEPVAGKLWAKVKDAHTGEILLIPSFEDLFRVTTAIVKCERNSFPNLPWEPAGLVRRFHNRSVDAAIALLDRHPEWPPPARLYEPVWARLADEFKLRIDGPPEPLRPSGWTLTEQDAKNARDWGLDRPDPAGTGRR